MKDSTQLAPQFCIIENAIALAVKKKYCLAVHTPYKHRMRQTSFYSGIQLRNIELYLVRDWVNKKYNVWCWAHFFGNMYKYRPYSKKGVKKDFRIKYELCNSYQEAIAFAITEVLTNEI